MKPRRRKSKAVSGRPPPPHIEDIWTARPVPKELVQDGRVRKALTADEQALEDYYNVD